jgi:hypothetical protein
VGNQDHALDHEESRDLFTDHDIEAGEVVFRITKLGGVVRPKNAIKADFFCIGLFAIVYRSFHIDCNA